MKTRKLPVLATVAALMVAPGVLHAQTPVGTEFTYQGQLKDGGTPADGDYDSVFRLYDADIGGARWLEVSVRPGDSSGNYTTLSTLQAITTAPVALYTFDQRVTACLPRRRATREERS